MMSQEKLEEFALRLHPTDDVAVATRPLPAGLKLVSNSLRIQVRRDVPPGHKRALVFVAAGAAVKKYGQVIGFAKEDIVPGSHVHTHNLIAQDFSRDYQFCMDARPVGYYPPEQMRTFEGYARPDGHIG